MRRLLSTTVISLVTLTDAASAQSVLERVLSTIDASTNGQLAPINGTFANIAENIGGVTPTRYVGSDGGGANIIPGEDYTGDEFDKIVAANLASEEAKVLSGSTPGMFQYDGGPDQTEAESLEAARVEAALIIKRDFIIIKGVSTGVDGSITNSISSILDITQKTVANSNPVSGNLNSNPIVGVLGSNPIVGILDFTQEAVAGTATASEIEIPLFFNFGAMAVTALGAVNTGDIALGVNKATDEARTKSTEAVSTVIAQLGGSVNAGSVVLNIASNMTGINGSITNTMGLVNGMTGDLSTTALGAVNTGKIVNGVDSAVDGIVGVSGP